MKLTSDGPLMPEISNDSPETRRTPYDRPLAFVDLETTGLDPDVHEIIEIAMVQARQPDLHVLEEWDCKIRPSRIETATPKALEVNGYTPEGWGNAVSLQAAMNQFIVRKHRAILVAYKVDFDSSFLKRAMKETGHAADGTDPLGYYVLDGLSMAWQALYGAVPQFRLSAIALYLGLEPEPEPHSALNGARLLYQVYHKLRGR